MTSIGLVFVKNDTVNTVVNPKGTPKKRSEKAFWPLNATGLNSTLTSVPSNTFGGVFMRLLDANLQ